MTLPVELETSVNQLRLKHAALIDAVTAYRDGTIDASKQDLLDLADDIDKQLTVEEYTLLGQVARKGRMPSLLLDFANGKYAVGTRRLERFTSLEDILTFSRSTGGGRFNAQGQYEWVEADVPRIDYDPMTGECRGLLVEEQRTNIFTRSRGMLFRSSPEFTVNAVVSPNGTQDATLINQVTAHANRYEMSIAANTYEAGQQFAISWYQKRVNYTGSGFTGTDGSLLSLSSLENATSDRPVKLESLPDGWERWGSVATIIDPALTARLRLYFGGTGFGEEAVTVTDPFAFWGIDIQPGRFHTSHIPTSGASVTRAIDTVRLASVVPWFNRSEGTFYMDVKSFPSNRISNFILTSGNDARFLYRLNNQPIGAYDGAAISSGGRVVGDFPSRLASWYDATSFRVVAVGFLGNLQQGGETLRAVRSLSIMYTDSGHLKRLEYYPRAFTESELQELTQ